MASDHWALASSLDNRFLAWPTHTSRVDGAIVVLKTSQRAFESFQMIFPRVIEGVCMDVEVAFLDALESVFHCFLCRVWGLFDSCWEAIALEFARRSSKRSKILDRIVQFERAALHGNIQFREAFTATALAKDIHDPRQRMQFVLDELAQLSEV